MFRFSDDFGHIRKYFAGGVAGGGRWWWGGKWGEGVAGRSWKLKLMMEIHVESSLSPTTIIAHVSIYAYYWCSYTHSLWCAYYGCAYICAYYWCTYTRTAPMLTPFALVRPILECHRTIFCPWHQTQMQCPACGWMNMLFTSFWPNALLPWLLCSTQLWWS